MGFDDDPDLKRLLREWQVPNAPGTMAPPAVDRPRRWWQRALRLRIPVPLPAAIVISLVLLWLAAVAVRQPRPAVPAPGGIDDLHGFRPVGSVNVRIERSGDALR